MHLISNLGVVWVPVYPRDGSTLFCQELKEKFVADLVACEAITKDQTLTTEFPIFQRHGCMKRKVPPDSSRRERQLVQLKQPFFCHFPTEKRSEQAAQLRVAVEDLQVAVQKLQNQLDTERFGPGSRTVVYGHCCDRFRHVIAYQLHIQSYTVHIFIHIFSLISIEIYHRNAHIYIYI